MHNTLFDPVFQYFVLACHIEVIQELFFSFCQLALLIVEEDLRISLLLLHVYLLPEHC